MNLRDGAAAARWAHNPKVGGSNPPPATLFFSPHKPMSLAIVFSNFFTNYAPLLNRAIPLRLLIGVSGGPNRWLCCTL